MSGSNEFELTDAHFEQLRSLVYDHTGISLSEAKRELVRRRFSPRLRELQLNSFAEYCQLIDDADSVELTNFTNAITTNLTSFFRENHHFEYLKNTLLPEFEQRKGHRRLRIWSAGCSTGEEPYSIAMSLREALPDINRWDIKILATDIDTDILNKAKRGIYEAKRFDGIPQERLRHWFLKGTGDKQGYFQANKKLKELIHFRHLNLMNSWPMRNKFDVIFCRNVIIYFDMPTKQKLVQRYGQMQDSGDCLFIGHSESLNNVNDDYTLQQQTIYLRN